MRNSQLRFPALTATVLRIQSYPAPGHPNVDCGFRRLTVTAPVCSQFFTCNELGGGLERPFLENSRFYGQPTLGAATLAGKDGRLTDNFFESGDVHTGAANAQGWRIERNTVNGAMICWRATNQIIRENYIRDGFSGLTDAFLRTNTVADNESDASRRLCAASVVVRTHQNITTTTPNSVYASASFAAGDLTPRDRIFISAKAKASWSATSNAFARVSITQDNVTTAVASLSSATPGAPLSIRGFLELNTDSALICELMIGEKLLQNALTTSSIAARGLTVKVEFWVSNPGEPINVRGARIVAVKPGMKHLPIE